MVDDRRFLSFPTAITAMKGTNTSNSCVPRIPPAGTERRSQAPKWPIEVIPTFYTLNHILVLCPGHRTHRSNSAVNPASSRLVLGPKGVQLRAAHIPDLSPLSDHPAIRSFQFVHIYGRITLLIPSVVSPHTRKLSNSLRYHVHALR